MNSGTSNSGTTSTDRVGYFRLWLVGGLLIVCAYMACRYHRGEQSAVMIHDCLDSNLPTRSVFLRSDLLLADSRAVFQPLLGGIPRGCLPSELFLPALPYRWLSGFQAFVLNEFVIRVVALLGMALLLRRHLLPGRADSIIVGLSLCFALLPFYPSVGLSVAGQPLLVYALWRICNRDHSSWNWAILGLYPFTSRLILVGFYALPILALMLIYRTVADRKCHGPLLAALLVLGIGYGVAEYRLIGQTLFPSGYTSHRVEAGVQHPVPFSGALRSACKNFLYGQYHVPSLQCPVMFLGLTLAGLPYLSARRRCRQFAPRGNNDGSDDRRCAPGLLLLLLACCAAISLWYGLYRWAAIGRAIDATGFKALGAVNLGRVHWLHPLLWTLVFALAVDQVSWILPRGNVLAGILIALQFSSVLRADLTEARAQPMSFRQFFSPTLFEEIRRHIHQPQSSYRVVSLGMHPSIALYNGFYTLDGYHYNYPLQHKQRFRKLIAGELEKDQALKDYFDNWGSRCYLFCSELGQQASYSKHHSRRKVEHLAVDVDALRHLGGRYILSAVEIGNAEELGLTLEEVFEQEDSPWQIFLYAVP